jgi:Tfp pilus assembly protein PilF
MGITDRIAQLQEFLKDEPEDPFNMYALALEYLKVDAQKSYALFEELIRTRPDYLPTYYPFAHLLIEQQKIDLAEKTFQDGIRRAALANEEKTRKELQGAYNDWMFDRD